MHHRIQTLKFMPTALPLSWIELNSSVWILAFGSTLENNIPNETRIKPFYVTFYSNVIILYIPNNGPIS